MPSTPAPTSAASRSISHRGASSWNGYDESVSRMGGIVRTSTEDQTTPQTNTTRGRLTNPDRTRYAAAGFLLLIVLNWVAVDAWRGNWGRVAFQGVLAGAVIVAILTLVRLPRGPKS